MYANLLHKQSMDAAPAATRQLVTFDSWTRTDLDSLFQQQRPIRQRSSSGRPGAAFTEETKSAIVQGAVGGVQEHAQIVCTLQYSLNTAENYSGATYRYISYRQLRRDSVSLKQREHWIYQRTQETANRKPHSAPIFFQRQRSSASLIPGFA